MAGGGGQTGEVQLLFYMALYVIIASLLLSVFATAMQSTAGMSVPVVNSDIKVSGSANIVSIGGEYAQFILTFVGLLVWTVPASMIPLEIQLIFIVFPKICIATICLVLLTRLIP